MVFPNPPTKRDLSAAIDHYNSDKLGQEIW